jgi:hypothetical protein
MNYQQKISHSARPDIQQSYVVMSSASGGPSSRGSSAGIVPTDFDVLLGRGKSNKNWPGNKQFQIMINSNRELYFSGLTQYEKKTMTSEIVQSVMKKGRFLKLDKKTRQWMPISAETARTKVAHALQYRNRQRTGKGTSAKAKAYRKSPSPTPPPSQVRDPGRQGQEKSYSEQNTKRDQVMKWNQFMPRETRVVSEGDPPQQKNPLKDGKATIATFDGRRKEVSFDFNSGLPGVVAPSYQRSQETKGVSQAFDDVDTDRLAEEYWRDLQAQKKKDAASQREQSGRGPSASQQDEAASMLLKLASNR